MIYLASPYTHRNTSVVAARFRAVCKATAVLFQRGHRVFSPIAHSHAVAKLGRLALGWDFWREIDFEWIRMCGAIWVLGLHRWEESTGVRAELHYAATLQLPKAKIIRPQELGIEDVPA